MKTRVTDEGIVIPRHLLGDMAEVEILEGEGMLIVVPVHDEDPIFQLGKHPVTAEVTDGSEKLDHYLYGAHGSS